MSGTVADDLRPSGGSTELATIQRIDWVEHDDFVAGAVFQYVNLNPNVRRHDSTLTSDDRVGSRVRYRVVFDQHGNHAYTLRLAQVSGPDYAPSVCSNSYRTDANGIHDHVISIPRGGGEPIYQLIAEDERGNTVRSSLLTVKRRLYVEQILMGSLGALSLAGTKREMGRMGIELIELPPYRHPVDTFAMFHESAENVLTHPRFRNPLKPFLAHVFRVQYQADPEPRTIEAGDASFGPNSREITIVNHQRVPGALIRVIRAMPQRGRPDEKVWVPFALYIDNEDALRNQTWFVSAKFSYYDGDGGCAQEVSVDASKLEPIASTINNTLYSRILVKPGAVPVDLPGTLTIEVQGLVHYLGESLGSNAVIVGSHEFPSGEEIGEQQQNSTITHELGHAIGMVPAESPTHYTGKGHTGSHCAAGLTAEERGGCDYSRLAGTCVMFGEADSSSKNPIDRFCPDCISVGLKLDLSSGFSG